MSAETDHVEETRSHVLCAESCTAKQPSHDVPGRASNSEKLDSLLGPVLFRCKYKLSRHSERVADKIGGLKR